MRLVLDNNVVFSLLKPISMTSYIFASLTETCFAPAAVRSELNRHLSECFEKSKLSKHEFELRLNEIEDTISFCELGEYRPYVIQALELQPDPRDSPYVALALQKKAAIWSNDRHLKKQSVVAVYTTGEMVVKLLRGEL